MQEAPWGIVEARNAGKVWEHRLGLKLPRGQLRCKTYVVLLSCVSFFCHVLSIAQRTIWLCSRCYRFGLWCWCYWPRHMDEGQTRSGKKISGLHAVVQEEAPHLNDNSCQFMSTQFNSCQFLLRDLNCFLSTHLVAWLQVLTHECIEELMLEVLSHPSEVIRPLANTDSA